jgi:Ni,Fe-hydrogenase III small subunit
MRPRSALRSFFAKPATEPAAKPEAKDADGRFRRSLQLRHVDAGSCNGCELEIASAFAPTYDAGQYGARLVASPRHADGLLVTGVVTRNMDGPLRKTLDAVPRPRVVVACGDCAVSGGVFAEGYGVASTLADVVAPDVEIPGCPPHPAAITEALRGLTGR